MESRLLWIPSLLDPAFYRKRHVGAATESDRGASTYRRWLSKLINKIYVQRPRWLALWGMKSNFIYVLQNTATGGGSNDKTVLLIRLFTSRVLLTPGEKSSVLLPLPKILAVHGAPPEGSSKDGKVANSMTRGSNAGGLAPWARFTCTSHLCIILIIVVVVRSSRRMWTYKSAVKWIPKEGSWLFSYNIVLRVVSVFPIEKKIHQDFKMRLKVST